MHCALTFSSQLFNDKKSSLIKWTTAHHFRVYNISKSNNIWKDWLKILLTYFFTHQRILDFFSHQALTLSLRKHGARQDIWSPLGQTAWYVSCQTLTQCRYIKENPYLNSLRKVNAHILNKAWTIWIHNV